MQTGTVVEYSLAVIAIAIPLLLTLASFIAVAYLKIVRTDVEKLKEKVYLLERMVERRP